MNRNERRTHGRMRCLKLRLFLKSASDLLRGRLFKIRATRMDLIDTTEGWYLLASFSTTIRWREDLGEINQNRVHNMRICADMIDGSLIEPENIFSFQSVVGEASPEKSFLDGPMIIRGELGFTSGGGLCQMTTTLFNAALLANLKILEKHNHSSDIWGEDRFIELGRDAVYVYARKDLRFQNTHGAKVLLRMKVDEAQRVVRCQVFSPKPLEGNVFVHSRIIQVIQPPERRRPKNEPGSVTTVLGWRVETIRCYEDKSGKRRTYYRRELYRPIWKRGYHNE
jgi:vancomycin resistance protein VanW